jgi:hypothetical protein
MLILVNIVHNPESLLILELLLVLQEGHRLLRTNLQQHGQLNDMLLFF